MTLSAHLLQPPKTESALAHLRAQLHPDIELTAGDQLPEPARYHVFIAGRPTRQHLLASPNLHTLVIPWAGLPEVTRDLMVEFPRIAVHNLHHNALPVAEHAIALLLAAAKFLIPMDRALREDDWRPRYQPNPSVLLEGKTALVLGYGAVGQKVARLCQGLGMNVRGIRRQGCTEVERASGEIPVRLLAGLDDLLRQAQVLIVCLPLTPETEGLIGAEELALLPSGAVLVNIGRGPIIGEGALYEALQAGTLYAAGLDVWYQYPEDEESRARSAPSSRAFSELENVVMSPHRAGGSRDTEMLRMDHLAALLNAAAQGGPIPNSVDLKAGY